MKEVIERALAPLAGLPMWGFARSADLLTVQFGARTVRDDGAQGEYALEVACAWRLAGPTSILVASGDLFTPADAEAELETFDWDPPGASWWDARIAELQRQGAFSGLMVTTFLADSYGGFSLVCSRGVELDVFPNSSAADHVETDFWKLGRPGTSEPRVIVGTAGVELVHES